MAQVTASSPTNRAPLATGWLLWLTWFFMLALALSIVNIGIGLAFGPDAIARWLGVSYQAPAVTVWWGAQQLAYIAFGVTCAGVLLRDRDFAQAAIVLAWGLAVLQCIEAALKILQLQVSIPIGAVLYAAFALKLSSVLRGRVAQAPARSGGML